MICENTVLLQMYLLIHKIMFYVSLTRILTIQSPAQCAGCIQNHRTDICRYAVQMYVTHSLHVQCCSFLQYCTVCLSFNATV